MRLRTSASHLPSVVLARQTLCATQVGRRSSPRSLDTVGGKRYQVAMFVAEVKGIGLGCWCTNDPACRRRKASGRGDPGDMSSCVSDKTGQQNSGNGIAVRFTSLSQFDSVQFVDSSMQAKFVPLTTNACSQTPTPNYTICTSIMATSSAPYLPSFRIRNPPSLSLYLSLLPSTDMENPTIMITLNWHGKPTIMILAGGMYVCEIAVLGWAGLGLALLCTIRQKSRDDFDLMMS